MRQNLDTVSSELRGDVTFFMDKPASPDSDGLGALEISPKLAGLVAWPLAVAVSTENVPEPQRRWLQEKLKVVAGSLGDSVLEAVAERGEFKF